MCRSSADSDIHPPPCRLKAAGTPLRNTCPSSAHGCAALRACESASDHIILLLSKGQALPPCLQLRTYLPGARPAAVGDRPTELASIHLALLHEKGAVHSSPTVTQKKGKRNQNREKETASGLRMST